ncbi:MAG: hypothetical protein ABSG04_13960 [Verrucomicrobiota bacterium]|jgi:hypothetical protein
MKDRLRKPSHKMIIHDRSLSVVPLKDGSQYQLGHLTRIEWLETAMHGKVAGQFKASIIDLAPLPEGSKPVESQQVPKEVQDWLLNTYGQAVLIHALVPRPFPPELGLGPTPHAVEIGRT